MNRILLIATFCVALIIIGIILWPKRAQAPLGETHEATQEKYSPAVTQKPPSPTSLPL